MDPLPEVSRVAAPRKAWPDIIFADAGNKSELAQAAKRGTIRRLGPGIYTGSRFEDPARVARRVWHDILAHELQGAVIADRSADTGVPDDAGRLFVVHRRKRPLELAGLSIIPRPAIGPTEGDIPLGDGTFRSSEARGLLDNLSRTGERFMTPAEVERWIARILSDGGPARLNAVRDAAREVAPHLGREGSLRRLEAMIGGALGTRDSKRLSSRALKSFAIGAPVDARRIAMFEGMVDWLTARPHPIRVDVPELADRRRLLPFFEAYFSNFIEGTRFSIEEAEMIALEGAVVPGRPKDSHDISGTFAITNDRAEMSRVPHDPQEFVDILRRRHSIIMAGRPENMPGLFKTRANEANGTVFVRPDAVEGTLRTGFEIATKVTSPFARAVFMAFLVAEVHPFIDGNGRVSRLMMNAELVSAGEVRIIVPTRYRGNYLSALSAGSNAGSIAQLHALLDVVGLWTSRVDWSSTASARLDLTRTQALTPMPGDGEVPASHFDT